VVNKQQHVQERIIKKTKYSNTVSLVLLELTDDDQTIMLTRPFSSDKAKKFVVFNVLLPQRSPKRKSKLLPPYNNLSGGCRLVQQVVKCSIYYNDLSGGCELVQQVVKCSIYYNDLSGGCELVQQVVKCSI
jgi:hypothetical protein